MKLYELSNELLKLAEDIGETGELTPDFQERLDKLEGDRYTKMASIFRLIKHSQSNQAIAKIERERVAEFERKWANVVEHLKAYLKANMEALGERVIEQPTFTIRIKNNSCPSVIQTPDVSQLPDEFKRIYHEIDKQALVEAWKEKRDLPAGVVIKVGEHILLK